MRDFRQALQRPLAISAQVVKLKDRFGIEQIACVGDRGMITSAHINNVLRPRGMDWISSLRATQIALLAHERGPFQPSLFDERNLLEIASDHFPGERLIVCRNPLLAEERSRKRSELLAATEAELQGIVTAIERVRAHVFLCLLAYYVEWTMRDRLKPMLFDDEFIEAAQLTKPSAVAKAQRSAQAKAKDASKHADDGRPVHSFRTLLQDLGMLTYNVTYTALNPKAKIILTTRPTPLQEKAFSLLRVNPGRTQYAS